MSEEIALNLPLPVIEELKCFICRGYLSSSPVLLLPPGNYICGRCAPLNTETPVHRLVPFESLLRQLSFPCIFKKHGCTELLLFGKTAEHESKCEHKPFGCPINVFATCSWEGNVTQFFQHFEDAHPSCIKEKPEFQLELTTDKQGVVMAVKDSFPFIVKYSYKAKECNLFYDVRFCGNQNEHEMSWKMQLINGNDLDCSINLKTNKCLSYDESFCGVQNAKVLDLSKFLENLADPDLIIIAVNFKIVKLNCEGTQTVDCNAIENLKCLLCFNYLTPPVFDLFNKTVCLSCSKTDSNSKLCEDLNLLKLVNEASYPCRWHDCNFVGKSNILMDHQINCEFRMSCCIYNCKISFKLGDAENHLLTHTNENIIYVPNMDKIIYNTSLALQYGSKDILALKNNNIIMLRCTSTKTSNNLVPLHQITLYRTIDNPNKITGSVRFEHTHCKVSNKISFPETSYSIDVTLKELPPCFQETDELTVTVEVVV